MRRFLLFCFVISIIALPAAAADGRYGSYVQTFDYGKIDWGEGHIIAAGKGVVPASGDEASAIRAAEVTARGNILKIINGVRLDGDRYVGDLADARIRLRGFIRGAERIDVEKRDGFYRVKLKVPINGVDGLSMKVLEETGTPRTASAVEAADKPFTGDSPYILIDARGTGLNPALFPEIVTGSGEVIYGPGVADRQALAERGMTRYVTAPDVEEALTRTGMKPDVIIPAQDTDSQKKRRRRGYEPIKIENPGTGGKLRANITVSDGDAEKLRKAEKESAALSECRVAVIMDSEIGGVEGKNRGGRKGVIILRI